MVFCSVVAAVAAAIAAAVTAAIAAAAHEGARPMGTSVKCLLQLRARVVNQRFSVI